MAFDGLPLWPFVAGVQENVELSLHYVLSFPAVLSELQGSDAFSKTRKVRGFIAEMQSRSMAQCNQIP